MKYRWGFLDVNDIFTECQPKVDDSTALDFTQESNEVFYRAKLNGSLAFRFEFDDILALGYNYEHRIVLQWYDADNDMWKDVWKGRFALTDCEVDYDTKTITVQPETLDKYTKILDALESEYNLVKLQVARQPVNILIRPCYQIYCAGSARISNYVGGNSWETDCESVTPLALETVYKFEPIRNCAWFTLTYTSGTFAGKYAVYYGRFNMSATPSFTTLIFPVDGRVYNADGTYTADTLNCTLELTIYSRWYFRITDSNNAVVLEVWYDELTDNYGDNYTAYQEGAMIENSYFSWDRFYGRAICQTDLSTVTIGGQTYTLEDFPSSDIGNINKNYNKILGIVATDVIPDIDVDDDPTGWPQTTNGWYFIKPADTLTQHFRPIAPDEWKSVSYWWYPTGINTQIEALLTSPHTIQDSYDLRNVIMRLMRKAGWNGQYFISGLLGGSQDYAGFRFLPIITPKSNVISSFYDTPAQNAPITLAKIISMLKQAYRIYWYIDENDNVHFEHISYFDNGYKYSEDAPDVLIDLETELHTNTKNNKVFGQNKIKFDKQDMPEQYLFSWMDKQTRPFDGFPIKCKDNYVQKGQVDEQSIGDFSCDIDMILTSPNDISKDGFVLMAMPSKGDNSYWTTMQLESFTIIDENDDRYNVTIQNADAAFMKIHRNMWRYDLPCENVNINNEETTAITTGRFKVQNVEFADMVMADILKDIDNCNLVIRTQQGDGHIKTLSINLNSLVAKGDLLFNFVGRWYYLKGTALGNSIIIFVNGESTTIEVNANKFTYRYKEPIATLKFNAADVVSVNFADCDKLDNLTSCDEMFDGCEELLAVDFGGKTFAAVTSANDMFRGCVALTTLICPDSSTWKADLDFSDCPDLTLESFYDLIKFLYYYNAGVHTITPNTTFWNALDADTQNDLIAKATDRGWTIGIPAQYSITGQSAANTVYATINGSPVEISVVGGLWQYDYNTPITSISFENDADVTDIDFSLSDGLAGLTSLNDAFKNCAGLTTVDFTNCDLSNVVSASDAFAGCVALYELIIPQDTWQPDVDLSDGVMPKTEMLNVINGLYVYTSGTHTITFNQTIWDAMSVADQQIVFDAADAKGWTTNAVMVIYYIRGKSTAATETFTITFIDDDTHTTAAETITCAVDGNGDWEYIYNGKRIYSLAGTFINNQTITEIEFTEDLSEATNCGSVFSSCTNLVSVNLSNATLANVINANYLFQNCTNLASVNLSNATFDSLSSANFWFDGCTSLAAIDMPKATFNSLLNKTGWFDGTTSVQSINLPKATFNSLSNVGKLFENNNITTLTLPEATFANSTNFWGGGGMIVSNSLKTLSLPKATFAGAINYSNVDNGMLGTLPNVEIISLPEATFENATYLVGLFRDKPKLTTISLPKATFANCVSARQMFQGCGINGIEISMPEATFASCTNAFRMFNRYGRTYGNIAKIDMPKATFDVLPSGTSQNGSIEMFGQNTLLTTLNVPNSSTFNATCDLRDAALTYQSMLNAANWLYDLSGGTAKTITFKASVWNALSSAEQTTLDTIISGKNWTRAIA